MATLPYDLDGVEYNFIAAQSFSYDFVVVINDANGNPVNLTGLPVRLIVRSGFADPALLTLTTSSSNSLLTVTPLTGRIAVHFDSVDTTTLAAPKNYVYDLRVNNYRKVWGTMSLRAGVTTSG
jgi:hypothetical protein